MLLGVAALAVLAVTVGAVRGRGRGRPRAVRRRPARHHADSSTTAFLPGMSSGTVSSGGGCSGSGGWGGDGGFGGGDCGGGGGSF